MIRGRPVARKTSDAIEELGAEKTRGTEKREVG